MLIIIAGKAEVNESLKHSLNLNPFLNLKGEQPFNIIQVTKTSNKNEMIDVAKFVIKFIFKVDL